MHILYKIYVAKQPPPPPSKRSAIHELHFVYLGSYEIFFVNPGSYFPGGHYYVKGLFISD